MDLWGEVAPRLEALRAENPLCTWILALSGGVDSVVLLHLLARFRQDFAPDLALRVAHLHHGIRGEAADRDACFAASLAAKLGLPFDTAMVDVPALAATAKIGLEEAGRAARHRFFANLAAAHKSGEAPALILLAQHQDDQLETILMNMERGAHQRGLAGMRARREITLPEGGGFTLVRPLLTVPKAALIAFATTERLRWHEDATNRDTKLRRNHIRENILPVLKRDHPETLRTLLAVAEKLGRDETELRERAGTLIAELAAPAGKGWLLRLNDELRTDAGIALHILRNLLEDRLGAENLNATSYTQLWHLISRATAGAVLTLPGKLRARRESDGLFLYPADAEPLPPEGELILPPPPFRISAYGVRLTATLHAAPREIPSAERDNPFVQWIDPNAVRGDLRLRARREGDRIWPLGAPGGKKVKEILIDKKVPQREKAKIRVLADYAGPLWLAPICITNRARLTEKSKNAIRLEMERLP